MHWENKGKCRGGRTCQGKFNFDLNRSHMFSTNGHGHFIEEEACRTVLCNVNDKKIWERGNKVLKTGKSHKNKK